jgi:hypothetical protein
LFNKAQDTLLHYPAGKTGSYTIPSSVTAIGNAAFASCPGLTSVTIPHTVNVIGDRAFAGCAGLTDIYINATDPPLLGTDVFDNVSNGVSVHVPCNRVTDYQNAAGWDYFTNITGDRTFNLTLQNNNPGMGTVQIVQANTCENNTAIIEAIANTGYKFSQWNDGNTQNPRTITVTQDTTFRATFELGVGIAERKASKPTIYPNPATDHINIVLPEEATQAVFILYDMQGKVLIKQNISNRDAIEVSNLASGIYIYNVTTWKQSYTNKIVIND